MMQQSISNLEDHIGYWLKYLSNQVHDNFSKKLATHNISVANWVVLRILFDNRDLDLSQAAELIGVDKSTLSRMIDRLIRQKLVKRAEGKNRRSISLNLTSTALELVPKLASIADENDKAFFKCMTPLQKAELLKTIKKILIANGSVIGKSYKHTME